MDNDALDSMGSSRHNLDDDGRFVLPNRVRPFLGRRFMMLRGIEDCIWLIPEAKCGPFLEEVVGEYSMTDPDGRVLARRFYGQYTEVEPDRQGRFVIPPALRDSAGLSSDRKVAVIGLPTHVELWDVGVWDRYDTALSAEVLQGALDRRLGRESVPAVPLPARGSEQPSKAEPEDR